MKTFTVSDNIYRKNFRIITDMSNEEFIDSIKRTHPNDPGVKIIERVVKNGCRGLFTADIKDYIYIYLESFTGTPEDWGTFHHELNHFVDYALDNVGIKGNLSNTEARAYYYEYICVKILRKIRTQKIKCHRRKARA